jgi:D-sedoheptulose 7-phosphate isomerase
VTAAHGRPDRPGAGQAGDAGMGDAGMESLYPFLYAGTASSDLDAVLAEIRSSTAQKAAEIVALRELVLERDRDRLVACAQAMAERFAAGARLFTFGNGGSATDALDLAALFLHPPVGAGPDGPQPAEPDSPEGAGPGRLQRARPAGLQRARPLPALSLVSDIATITALANDIGFEVVFARQLAAFARPGDVAVGLSTSGNSENLVRGFDEAARRGLLTVGLAGYEGGRMAEIDTVDHLFVVPSSSVHRIQEAQTTVYHVLWELTQVQLEEMEVAV